MFGKETITLSASGKTVSIGNTWFSRRSGFSRNPSDRSFKPFFYPFKHAVMLPSVSLCNLRFATTNILPVAKLDVLRKKSH
jgi:hypothetical protein